MWWRECKFVQQLWITVWRFLKKFKMELSNDPEIPLWYSKEVKSLPWRDICTCMFIATLFIVTKTKKQSKYPSMDEWMKMWICSEVSRRKSCNLRQCYSKTGSHYAKWNYPDSERQCLYIEAFEKNKKTKTDNAKFMETD